METHQTLKSFCVNSLAPGRFQINIRKVIFKLTLVNGGWCISYEIALRWMPQDLTDDKSTLVKVMAWCRQATSHYLSQCWPRSMSPNGVTRPQWVKRWGRDHSVISFNSWETTLQNKFVSHWLSPYTEWSLGNCLPVMIKVIVITTVIVDITMLVALAMFTKQLKVHIRLKTSVFPWSTFSTYVIY